jgi:hypothetical protein
VCGGGGRHGRRIPVVEQLLQLPATSKAKLSREEVIAVVLYSGPMVREIEAILKTSLLVMAPAIFVKKQRTRKAMDKPWTVVVLAHSVTAPAQPRKMMQHVCILRAAVAPPGRLDHLWRHRCSTRPAPQCSTRPSCAPLFSGLVDTAGHADGAAPRRRVALLVEDAINNIRSIVYIYTVSAV